jgi:hypothetical protein
MKTTNDQNLKVTVELTAKNYNEDGNVLNAIEASAKLTKADAERSANGDEDSISINASTCDVPTIEAYYQGQSYGKGQMDTTLELDLKGKAFDVDAEELKDVMSATAKLSKEDLGKDENQLTKDWYRLKVVKNLDSECASVESNYSTRNVSL